MGGTVENSIRDGNDQLVMKDETKSMCRVTESIQKQHGKISKPTSHFTSPHYMVTIYHQDTITRQDNDHRYLTDSHFSQDDQRCDNSSSLSHDTGSFSLSNTISSVDLTTWGPDVKRHNQNGRSMGSTDTTAVVTTRRGLARASQVWQDGRHDRTFNVLAPHLSTTKGANQYARWENCTKCQQRLSTEKRDYWKEAKVVRVKALEKEEMARRMEEQKNRAFRSAPRRPRPRARVPTLEQMNDQLRNDQPNKNESGPGPAPRTPTVAASSSTNDHLEEVLKGQAQQALFLQHMWVQQSQMQQALQQQVCALSERNASRTRSPRGRSPVVECFDCPARITSKELAPIHSVKKWHPAECFFHKTKSGCRFGEKCSYVHRQVDEQPSKRSKKNDDKSAVAMLKKYDLHDRTGQSVVNHDKSHDRTWQHVVKRDTVMS